MTAQKAYDEALKTFCVCLGEEGHYFTALIWKSKETGTVIGPFLACVTDDVVIEVNEKGEFRNTYSSKADCYSPYYSPNIKTGNPYTPPNPKTGR